MIASCPAQVARFAAKTKVTFNGVDLGVAQIIAAS